MSIGKPPKILLLYIWYGFCLLCTVGSANAELSKDTSWHIIDSKYTRIRYHSWKDLKKFNNNISYSYRAFDLKGLFTKKSPDDLKNEIKLKIDAVYERVQEILDMRKSMKKVIINIYHDKKALHAAYQEIFEKPCRLRAWYLYELNTIYINVLDTHEGMIAHEIAHSIIDHYLLVRPPKATAEILSRYVDEHL